MNITGAPMIPAPSADALIAYRIGIPCPLRSHLQLPALTHAVPSARLHTRQALREWQLNCLTDVVELIVSELVTNAVRAGSAVPVRLWLCSDRERVAIQVWDASDRMPVRQDPGPGADSGRGVLIVDALSADWGAYRPATVCGKVVWAIVAAGCGVKS